MKDLLEFILKSILPSGSEFNVVEEDDGSLVKLTVTTSDEVGGLVIGKAGKVVKAIRNILRIRAVLDHKKVILSVNPVVE